MTDSPSPDLFRAQLFLDDGWIEDSCFVQRVWHQAKKAPEPVLRSESPWECDLALMYGTVLKREGRFRMWYGGYTRRDPPDCAVHHICYAESDDGLHWDKPRLGLHEFDGSRDNNIVITSASPNGFVGAITVIDDPEDAEWPLKALYYDHDRGSGDSKNENTGIRAARSRDGIDWQPIGLVLPQWGDRFNALPCRVDGKFVYLGRGPGPHGPGRFNKKRLVFHAESPDLLEWSPPELVLQPDPEDPAPMQFYSAVGFPYEGQVLAGIERMHMTPDVLDTEIAWSRDGRQWQRSRERPRFIEWGAEGAFDSRWLNLSSSMPIHHHGHLWFYYSGRAACHVASTPHQYGAIGLATLRVDGFCSLFTGDTSYFSPPGKVLTRPMTWVDGELLVNADPRANLEGHPRNTGGRVRVEVRGEDHAPLAGFSFDECIAVERDTSQGHPFGAAVRWQGERTARQLAGQRIRLVFELDRAHLYSFRAGGDVDS